LSYGVFHLNISIHGLRELRRVIDNYLDVFSKPREAMPGDEFHFNETVTFVFPVGIRVNNLAEFLTAVNYHPRRRWLEKIVLKGTIVFVVIT